MTSESRITLEICCDSLQGAIDAIENGADRLEVCGNLGVGGGVTPPYGLVQCIRARFPVTPIHVMIRPRIGTFFYTETEIDVMRADIALFKPLVDGLVFGVLNADLTINVPTTVQLVADASPLPVAFHRAFDLTPEPVQALDAIAGISGITRILTSGHAPKAPHALPLLSQLARLAFALPAPSTQASSHPQRDRKLLILPGSGLTSKSLPGVLAMLYPAPTNVREVHCSCGGWVTPVQTFANRARNPHFGFGLGGELDDAVWTTSGVEVRAVRDILDEFAITSSVIQGS